MKLQIQREDILQPLQQVIGAVEKRQTLPALANVLLRCSDTSISLTATDLEIELLTDVQIKTDEAGETTLPARKFLDICKSLAEEAIIKISVDDNKAVITSGRNRFSLATLPSADFPTLDEFTESQQFNLPQKVLKRLIEKTSFAMAQQDVRYYLNGLLIEVESSMLRTVATDGHRLSYCEEAIESTINGQINDRRQVILPRKGVHELSRMLSDTDEPITISLGDNHLQAQVDGVRLTSKLIDGRFPDYNRVMPPEEGFILTADRTQLRQCLSRASILSNEKYRGLRLVLDKDLLKLQAQNPDQEEAEVEMEVDYKGDAFEVGFNVNYMLDVLASTDAEVVTASLMDANSSCLMSFPDEPGCKYVIMPMRL